LAGALQAKLGAHVAVTAPDQGMQMMARLRPGVDDIAVARAAAARGVTIRPLSATYVAAAPVSALMLGFTGYDHAALQAGVDRLVSVFRDFTP
jgi:GntR family transcriptional regulator/MocR family aminotransferase